MLLIAIIFCSYKSVASFKTLVSKLTNLREFYLDGVNILEDNRAGAELLEKFVPRL